MNFSYKVCSPEELEPYSEQLAALERQMRYPLAGGEDSFVIDHGEIYHLFFSQMGRTRFVVFFDGDRIIGSVAGVWKRFWLGRQQHMGLYAADLKLDPKYRGQGLFKAVLWRLILRWTYTAEFQGWDCVYFLAMQGEKGNVSRSFKGPFHLGRLSQPAAELDLFFVLPEQLQGLQLPALPKAEGVALRLSELKPGAVQLNTGRKDFMLESTGEPWKLAHLGPIGADAQDFAQRLMVAGAHLQATEPSTLLCFAVDKRRQELLAWLSSQGVVSDTSCSLGAVSFFCPSLRKADWVDVSTAEF